MRGEEELFVVKIPDSELFDNFVLLLDLLGIESSQDLFQFELAHRFGFEHGLFEEGWVLFWIKELANIDSTLWDRQVGVEGGVIEL